MAVIPTVIKTHKNWYQMKKGNPHNSGCKRE